MAVLGPPGRIAITKQQAAKTWSSLYYNSSTCGPKRGFEPKTEICRIGGPKVKPYSCGGPRAPGKPNYKEIVYNLMEKCIS